MAKYSGSYEQTMVKLEQMAQATNAQQMNWQEKMSKTSHQMEVADLVAAGLNPVLSSGGSGAQSYTTSLDSAASAVGNLASAHESASATRYAARQSAAATRAAAAANLAAAREAAAASRYSADRGYQSSKYSSDMSYKAMIDKPVDSIGGVLDRLATKSGLYDLVGKDKVRNAISDANNFLKNPEKYFIRQGQNDRIRMDNYRLSHKGESKINTILGTLGIKATAKTRDLFMKGIVWNHAKFFNQLLGYTPHRSINSGRTLR